MTWIPYCALRIKYMTICHSPSGDGVVGKAGDVRLALLDDGESEHGQVAVHDASAHRLALALAGATRAVAGVALR